MDVSFNINTYTVAWTVCIVEIFCHHACKIVIIINNVRLQLSSRTVLLKLASIAVLMITLYVEVGKRCSESPETCCQQVLNLCYTLLKWHHWHMLLTKTSWRFIKLTYVFSRRNEWLHWLVSLCSVWDDSAD